MSQNNPFRMIIIGAALMTVASILVPINILFLRQSWWPAVIITGVLQVALLVIGGLILWQAQRDVKK